jgi:hypothetical protein
VSVLVETDADAAVAWLDELLDLLGSQPASGDPRQCPVRGHGQGRGDRHPSLSLFTGCALWTPTNRHHCDTPCQPVARLHCHADCKPGDILRALRLHPDALRLAVSFTPAEHIARARLQIDFPPIENLGWPKRRGQHPTARGYHLAAVHDYPPSWFVERWRNKAGDKELIWWTRQPTGDVPGLLGARFGDLPLYREAEIRQATALGEPVLIVESESSVDALKGWFATTWAGGATAVQINTLTAVLGGYPHTVVIPDHDDAGLRALARLRAYGLAPHVLLPALGEDARDMCQRLGHDRFAHAVAEVSGR